MIGLLFPEATVERKKEELLRDRRVAHEHVLRFYLERVVGDDLLSFYDAERAFARMANRHELDGFMRSLDPARWQDVIVNLNSFEFSPRHVEPGIIVFLNLLPDMPGRSQGVFDTLYPPEVTVRKVARGLLQVQENNAASVEAATRSILPEVTTLSSKLELVSLVGHQPESGPGLVSEPAATEFEKTLRAEIQSASVNDLVEERTLAFLLPFAKNVTDPSDETFNIDASPKLTFAILKSAATFTTSESSNSFAVDRSTRLPWDFLVDLYGDEATLKARIGA